MWYVLPRHRPIDTPVWGRKLDGSPGRPRHDGGFPRPRCPPYGAHDAPQKGRRVGVPKVTGGLGGRGLAPDRTLHWGPPGDHRPVDHTPPHLRIVHGDGETARIDATTVLVGAIPGPPSLHGGGT